MPNQKRRRARGYADPTEATFNSIFRDYQRSAKARNYEFTLTKEQFRALTKQPCFYCARAPYRSVKTKHGIEPLVYTGIDRASNDQGYTPVNSIPCCFECNSLKGATNFDEFLASVSRIAANLIAKFPYPIRRPRNAAHKTSNKSRLRKNNKDG